MEKEKPIVGQVLYSLNIGNAAGRGQEQKLTKVYVTKVGRKYFSCGGKAEYSDWNQKYYISDWGEKTIYCEDSRLYETEQEYYDEKETKNICRKIRDAFEYGDNRNNIILESLREILRIIEP